MSQSYWNSIERAYHEVSIYDGAETFEQHLERFPDHVGDLLAAHWFLSEMSNGGISQFFANSTAIVAERATTAFEKLGFPSVADAVKKGIGRAADCSTVLPPSLFDAEERAI